MKVSESLKAPAGGATYRSSREVEAAIRQMLDNVRKLPNNRFSARCPLHDDKENSLSIDTKDGFLMFHCYAGCDPKKITDYLYERYPEHGELLLRGTKIKATMEEKLAIAEGAKDWYANYTSVPKDFLSTLPITFTSTEIIFRFDGIDRYKVRIKGEKGAIWRGSGHTPDLWPLPSEKVGEDIVITEGESDCVVLRSLGLEAYAVTKGAAHVLPSSVFVALRRRGARRVVVAMDADAAGRQAATKLVLAARQAGLAAIDLDLVAEGLVEILLGQKDLRDAYKAGRGADIVEAIRHMLYRADEAKPIFPRTLREIMQEENITDFIIEGFLRQGGTAILAGEPKLGKSQLALDIALAITRGEAIAGLNAKKGKVIYYALEDGEDIVRERVRARGLGGNDDLFVGTIVPVVNDNVSLLEEHIDMIQPSLVIIDTLRATAVGTGRNENEAGYADSLYRIAKLCRERSVSAIIIHHTVKSSTKNPIVDARGTSAITGSVDVVAGLYKDDNVVKLIWRGRYGSGEIKLEQYSNGSFNYRPLQAQGVGQSDNEEFMRKLEERLNQYEVACRKHADATGRIDVRKVVVSIWGIKDGKYPDGAWNKTYKALDELVRRHKLRKQDRAYYILSSTTEDKEKGETKTPVSSVVKENNNTIYAQPQAQKAETIQPKSTEVIIDSTNGTEVNKVSDERQAFVEATLVPRNSPEPLNNLQSANNLYQNTNGQQNGKNNGDNKKKRRLLAEVKAEMQKISGDSEMFREAKKQFDAVFEALVKQDYESAKHQLSLVSTMVYSGTDRVSAHEQRAIETLYDMLMFALEFAVSDERERGIGWRVWDEREKYWGRLHSVFVASTRALEMIVKHGKDIREAIAFIETVTGYQVGSFVQPVVSENKNQLYYESCAS